MFSGLAKLADKAFLVGYFLPALFGLAAFTLANQDWPPFCEWVFSALHGGKEVGDVIAVLFVIWAIAVTLMGLNDVAIRFLEGYYWPFTTNFFVERQRVLFRKLNDKFNEEVRQVEEAELLVKRAENAVPTSGKSPTEALKTTARNARIRKNAVQERLVRQYVTNEKRILGTRLGNTLRAFETYPEQVYGVPSIVTWPRLLDAMSKDFRGLLDDARASFDMCAGFILVFTVVFLVALCRLAFAACGHEWGLVVRFGLTSMGSFAAVWLFYKLAIHNAEVWWGEVFKSGYDLYLRTLAEKMGYDAPIEPQERREFWKKVGWQFRYHEEIDLSKFAKKHSGEECVTEVEQAEETEELEGDEKAQSKEARAREPKQ